MLKILLVDDEAQERKGIAFLIQKYRYSLEIAEAVNGQKAMDYISKHPVDILFTDVKMPYKDGLALAKEVYEYNPKIKIIIYSAYGEFEYAKKALEANAVDYLLKPIELEEFQRVMDSVLDSIEKLRQQEEGTENLKKARRKNLMYKLLSRAQLSAGEQQELDGIVFSGGNRDVMLVNLESAGNLFEKEEERFRQLLAMYLKQEAEYMNLYPNESCLIIYGPGKGDENAFRDQLEKLIRDVSMVFSDQLSVILGRRVETMKELSADIQEIHEMRSELFGFPQQVFGLSDGINKEYYAKEAEELKAQFIETVKQGNTELLPETAEKLVEALEKSNMVSRIYVEHLFYELLHAIFEQLPGDEQEGVYQSLHLLLEGRSSRELMERFLGMVGELGKKLQSGQAEEHGVAAFLIRIIEKEYPGNLSLDYLAEQVHLAPAYVSYMFKQETGETLVKYITDYRMKRAKELLEEQKLKIVQVGQACGYDNQSYFNRLFKNYFGMTPKQYRERIND